MGMLIDGRWIDDADQIIKDGAFVRAVSSFDTAVPPAAIAAIADGAASHVLIASFSCPWSHRTTLVRALKGLGDRLPMRVAGGPRVQGYGLVAGTADLGLPGIHVHQLYTATDPAYTGRATVPVLWDRARQRIVSSGSAQIMRALDAIPADRDFVLVPSHLSSEIESINHHIHGSLSNAVYRAGLAQTQSAYAAAVSEVFATLEGLEARLAASRYLLGNVVTESDWRLFPTLIRFDAVYNTHFRCTRRRLVDYPALSAYSRDLFGWHGIAATVDFDAILAGYYLNDADHNPHAIVAELPAVDWRAAHGRDHLGPSQVWSRQTGVATAVDPATLSPIG